MSYAAYGNHETADETVAPAPKTSEPGAKAPTDADAQRLVEGSTDENKERVDREAAKGPAGREVDPGLG